MLSDFSLSLSVAVGGMILAGICHEFFTPNLDFCYMVWLWICQIPFVWIVSRVFRDRIRHPVANYVGFLPYALTFGALMTLIGPRNAWFLPAVVIATAIYFSIAERVGKSFFPSNDRPLDGAA